MKFALQGRQLAMLIAVSVPNAVTNLDYYGLAVALPAIGHQFRTNAVELEWVMNASLITYVAPLIALGRLTDVVGARAMAVIGALLFAAGAAGSGLCPTVGLLIAARAVQGLGNAMITLGAMALVTDAFGGQKQSAAVGLVIATSMIGGVVGPFLAGAITDALSWRWFFFFISGVTALGFLMVVLMVDKVPPQESEKKADLPGFLLLTASLLLLILGLQFVDSGGWFAPRVGGCISASAACLLVFWLVERRIESPLVDVKLFRNPSFTGACIMLFLVSFPYGALLFYLALYLQHVLGFSALVSGVVYLALLLPTTLVSLAAGRAHEFAGPRLTLTVSVVLIATGFVCFGFMRPDTSLAVVIVGLLLVGTGRGLSGTVPFGIGLAAVSPRRAGEASGILETISTISMPIGIATFGAFFRTWENEELAHIFELAGSNLDRQTRNEIFGLLSGSEALKTKLVGFAPDIAGRIEFVTAQAFSYAFRNLMFLSIALSILVPVFIYLVRHEESATSPAREETSDDPLPEPPDGLREGVRP